MGRTESSTAGAIHVHLSCNLYAKICTIVLQTVILPLIASVFYHDALLSPARSSGSCHKGLLSARVRWNKHGPASLSWTLLRQTGQRAKDRERESYSPLLSLSLSLSLFTDHITRRWWPTTPSPLALALGCISHYLHRFRCCNQQMEQPPWRSFTLFEQTHPRSKGKEKKRHRVLPCTDCKDNQHHLWLTTNITQPSEINAELNE